MVGCGRLELRRLPLRNPGTRLLAFAVTVSAKTAQRLVGQLVPAGATFVVGFPASAT